MWFHPWGTIFAIAAIVTVLAAMALTPKLSREFFASLVPVVITALAFLAHRRNARS